MELEIEKAFDAVSRVLFGEEIGKLADFDAYLKEAEVGKEVVSSFSGKKLWVTSEQYCAKARFFEYEKEHGKMEGIWSKPLATKDIKDIDSLLDAVRERLVYSGNKVLGNSKFVEYSDNVVDCTYAYGCSIATRSKFVYRSYLMRENEYTFGSTSSGESSYIMRCFYNNTLKRCFECVTSVGSADCYFTYNLVGCSDCMFTFNVRNKRNMVGNVQLEREEYKALKKKLVAEMADELKRKKRMDLSIIDIMNL